MAGWVQLAAEVALVRNAEEQMAAAVVDTLEILEVVEKAAQVVVADMVVLEVVEVVPGSQGNHSVG